MKFILVLVALFCFAHCKATFSEETAAAPLGVNEKGPLDFDENLEEESEQLSEAATAPFDTNEKEEEHNDVSMEGIHIGGKLKHVAVSVGFVWGVDHRDYIFRCVQPCKGQWVHVPGLLRQVDLSDDEVWGTNRHNQIFKRPSDGSGGWVRTGGLGYHVSASGNGYMWVVGNDRCPWKCRKPCTGHWFKVGGLCGLKQLDAGEEFVYAITTTNRIYSIRVDGTGAWRLIPGSLTYVTVGTHAIFGVNSAGQIWRCRQPCVGEWETVPGTLKQVEASLTHLFGVNAGNFVYYYRLPY